ncbi:hypothetical protein UFOVP724_159 [uncultured Caudovirales phage]|uniref:Uncharacterized protein n=1 Tax=uncultured Caudovirales phage TaxID=2100421 RepID=A0A6J5NND4_9CAUD|nr:hypothetical protein UFOVP724_159 [uncultured Caudovirales phage]
MRQASPKNTKSVADRNKEFLSRQIYANNKVEPFLVDVLVLEVLEKGDASEWIPNYKCEKGIEFVLAFSVLHKFYHPYVLETQSIDFLRSTYGSNGNILGREFQILVKGKSEEDLSKGKLVLASPKDNQNNKKDMQLEIPFSFGSLKQIFGSIEDRLAWQMQETSDDIGYVWQQIKSFDVKDIGNEKNR